MSKWLLPLIPFALFLAFLAAVPGASEPRVIELPLGTSEELGTRLSFRLDGLSILFALLITGIGTLIYAYGTRYLAGRTDLPRFWSYFTLFMISMLGLTLAENLITLFIFWELTSLSSYLLIGIDHERPEARDAALKALLVTGGGGMALLAGFVLIGSAVGSFELTSILAQGDLIRAHPHYIPILILVLLGAFTKSAQVPFHFWLPAAMEAPTPVSAYLHSATMVKAGVYLLARLLPALGGSEEWIAALAVAGALTMVSGAVMAVLATDLKQILAYSTMSALGSMVMLLGIGTPAAVQAAIVFLFAHALYKAALFLVAGIVDHETGTRDVRSLGGLRRLMPLTATAAILGAVSLASFGPVLSFAAKEMMVMAIAAAGEWRRPLEIAIYTSAVLLAAAAALVAIKPFFGVIPSGPRNPGGRGHDPSAAMWLPPLLLATAGVVLALIPGPITAALLAPASAAVHQTQERLYVSLWHGINAPLLLAAAATAAGFIVYRTRERWIAIAEPLGRIGALGPTAWYGLFLRGMNATARAQTRVLQSGYLRVYLMIILVTLIALVLMANAAGGGIRLAWRLGQVALYEAVVAALIIAGAITASLASSRLGAIAALGVVGYSVAINYVIFSAPDLAMTQFVIETLTVILFVLVIYRLPRFSVLTPPPQRVRDAVLATLFGAVITLLVLAAQLEPVRADLAAYYGANAYVKGHGRNLVNVILVDFRALDTLGEITVIGIAAIGVYALLRMRPEVRP
ncbi:MAG TPA: hydrogen gas-evolving membrane-bound hydrogenase subunit E [Thermoanaerobaculia bacterium]|nr:hydrogen gas-evolving membrane-bound hydrogenase subunit E [Thermoanaerobaculia bacterium]